MMICARNPRITKSWAHPKASGALFAALGENVGDAPPLRPAALTQDELIGLFDGKDTGAGIVLEPATEADMRSKNAAPASLKLFMTSVRNNV